MRLPGSLRARVTLGAVGVTSVVLLLLTVALQAAIARDGRAAVDRELRARAASVTGPGARPRGRFGGGPGQRGAEPLLAGSGTFVQVAIGGEVVDQRGDVPPGAPGVPSRVGLHTVRIAGTPWRSLTVPATSRFGAAQLQLLQSLAGVDDRVAATRRIVLVLGGLALLLVAGAAWALTTLAVRPLAALRDSAASVGADGELRPTLPVVGGPDEVRELGAGLNAMLARLGASAAALQRALEATRRFAADAGHELRTPLTGLRANVDVLRRNPELPAGERDAVLAEVAAEQERIVHLLDGLTALARGEAAGALPREPVELADLVDAGVGAARRRHPGVAWSFAEDVGGATVEGWAGGLRLMLDNLLENAALHGRADGHVRVALREDGSRLVLRVDDDGPGVPVAEREAVLEPFRRGWDPRSAGTGLGLAIAAQQAALHGGRLVLGDSPLGGLGAEVALQR